MVLNTKNRAVACFQMANELCKDVRSIERSANPKPWNTDGKVRAQAELIRKVFDILYGDLEISNDEFEPDVACLKIAYDLCDSLTTIGTTAISSSTTDEGVISQAEAIRSIFDILHTPAPDLPLFQ